MKMGLMYADRISTVSQTYAKEIQTWQYGYGMDGILKSRKNVLSGIINGIDYVTNDPATDKRIQVHFDADHLEGKAENKRLLQERLGLEQRDVPIIGMITRLADQKGLDILSYVFDEMMCRDVQFVLLGTGKIVLNTCSAVWKNAIAAESAPIFSSTKIWHSRSMQVLICS